jgi:RNA polymerase sigma factor (sigma-70 family)
MPTTYQHVAQDRRRKKARPALRSAQAAEELFNDNRGLAWRFMVRYGLARHRDFDDLLQAALIGLWRACELFDPALGFKLSTYADRWMRQCVGRAAREGCIIHVPQHVSRADFDALAARIGGLPGEGKAAEERGVGRGDWGPAAPEDLADKLELAQRVERALARLPKRLALVLRLRFLGEMSLAEIGERLNVCRERVRQLERKGLQALRRREPALADLL